MLFWYASFTFPPALPTGALLMPDFGRSGLLHLYVLVFCCCFFGMQAILYMLYGLPAVALRAHDFLRCSYIRRTGVWYVKYITII